MKRILLVALLICFFTAGSAQTKGQKWVAGVSGSFVNFGDSGATSNLGERFNIQVPKLTLTRYLWKGFSLEGGVTLSIIDELGGFYSNSFNYLSIDYGFRYDFNLSEENLVPYFYMGGSIINGPSTIQGSKATPTFNIGFGGTYWITHHWGLNVQGTYKYSQADYESMRSHSQVSVGIVYSFSPRVLVYRIWDGRRH